MGPSLTDALRETLALFDGSGTPRTTSEVADSLGIGRHSAYERLERLVDLDRLETKKVGANGRVWWRPIDDGTGRSSTTEQPTTDASLLEDVLGSTDVGVFVLEEGGEVAWVNDAVERYFGLERECVLGRDVRGVLEEELAPAIEDPEAFLETAFAADGDASADRAECHVTGGRLEERWLECHSEPIETGQYAGGRVDLYYDVTDQRESERELERERVINDRFLRTSPVGIAVFEPDGTIDRMNERMAELFGTRPDALADFSAGERKIYDEDGNQLAFEERPVGRVFETGDPVFEQEIQLEDVTGQRRWLSVNAVPFGEQDRLECVREDGHECVVAIAMDITRFKEQTRRLERQRDDLESELEEVFDRIGDAVHGLDTEWRFTYLNDRAEELLGKSEEELLGTYVWDAFPDDLDRSYRDNYELAMEAQQPVVFEEYSEAANAWLEVTAYPSESGLSVYFHDITDRKERERELEIQRERLAALNELNEVVHDITEAVITRSTREEIEATVCERLAEARSYEFAWIGEVDVGTQTIEPRAEAGVEDYLEEITISVDPDNPLGQGPAGKAVRTRELQVVPDARTDPALEPWREHVEEHGYRSIAAIPIVHEDTLYGLLAVYADRPEAFSGEEGNVIATLGEIVGHAIAAIERKHALVSDEVIELEFRIREVFEVFGLETPTKGTITLEQAVPVENGEYLVYGTATGDAADSVEAFVDAYPNGTTVRFWDDQGETSFEVRLTDPPVLSTVPSLGGVVENAVFEDGDCRMTLHLAPGGDVRKVIEAVENVCSDVELLRQRQLTRQNETSDHVRAVLSEELTDRQRAALEAAYHAGYFEWPREASGEDVADALEVASPTFHQHLRLAQQKVFDSLL